MSVRSASRWLVLVGVGACLAAFGLALALVGDSALMDVPIHRNIDPVFSIASDIASSSIVAFRTWTYAVLGATICGWCILLAAVARFPLRERRSGARNAIAATMGAWFSVDTTVSLLAHALFNVLFHVAILLAISLPLLLTWQRFELETPRWAEKGDPE